MTALRVAPGLTGGDVSAGGHKHSCVPIVAASALHPRRVVLEHAPAVEDARVMAEILARCGAQTAWRGDVLLLDSRSLCDPTIPPELSRRIHGASYLIPAYLGRLGAVECSSFGGCSIGAPERDGERPLHHVLDVLERFGARFTVTPTGLQGVAERLSAVDVDVRDYSDRSDVLTGPLVSGATKTALLAAAAAHGTSVVHHPYPKPDTWELVAFLRACGHRIDARPERVTVTPVRESLAPVRCALPSDLGEVMTFLAAGLLLRVPVRVRVRAGERVRRGLAAELAVLAAMGVDVTWTEGWVQASAPNGLRAVDIEVTSVGIYSDHQPLFAVLLLHADRPSRIVERVWTNRFGYAAELAKLGARLTVEGDVLRIEPSRLRATDEPLLAGDVRAAAALVVAALGAQGTSVVCGAQHLARGYGDFAGALRGLGATIEELQEVPA